jgi:hypothetical protein
MFLIKGLSPLQIFLFEDGTVLTLEQTRAETAADAVADIVTDDSCRYDNSD